MPLTFVNPEDYQQLQLGNHLVIENVGHQLAQPTIIVKDITANRTYEVLHNFSDHEKLMIRKGGKINL